MGRLSNNNNTQSALPGFGIKHNARLCQYPGFNLFMVQAQQLQRPYRVMLFSRGAGLVPHDLRHDAGGHFKPLGQRFEGPAQAVQGQPLQTSHFASDRVRIGGL